MSLFTISLACAAISFTISWTSIFAPVRNLVSKVHPKLEELVHCPWCLNHYVVLLALAVTGGCTTVVEFVLHWFAAIGLGGVVHYVLLRAYEPVARNEMHRKARRGGPNEHSQ